MLYDEFVKDSELRELNEDLKAFVGAAWWVAFNRKYARQDEIRKAYYTKGESK